jgi:hypothetical protein
MSISIDEKFTLIIEQFEYHREETLKFIDESKSNRLYTSIERFSLAMHLSRDKFPCLPIIVLIHEITNLIRRKEYVEIETYIQKNLESIRQSQSHYWVFHENNSMYHTLEVEGLYSAVLGTIRQIIDPINERYYGTLIYPDPYERNPKKRKTILKPSPEYLAGIQIAVIIGNIFCREI